MATHDMRELRAVWVVDGEVLNGTTQLVHAVHVPSQANTRTDNITRRHRPCYGRPM